MTSTKSSHKSENNPKLSIQATKTTPKIFIDINKGIFEIEGNSIPEDPANFYLPINDFIKNFKTSPASKIKINIKLNYYNSATSKYIVYIILSLKKEIGKTKQIELYWQYQEEDEISTLQDILKDIKIHFYPK